jgi:hypothetical protein
MTWISNTNHNGGMTTMNTQAQATVETPVINFAESKVNRRAKPQPIQLAHPDAPLITACVAYAAAMGGVAAAFCADPTADSDFAQAVDIRALAAARKHMAAAANYLPSTMDGLRAKAEIVIAMLETETATASVKPFMRSLVEDIARFHQASSVKTDSEIAP